MTEIRFCNDVVGNPFTATFRQVMTKGLLGDIETRGEQRRQERRLPVSDNLGRFPLPRRQLRYWDDG